jgi:hypothetical protein
MRLSSVTTAAERHGHPERLREESFGGAPVGPGQRLAGSRERLSGVVTGSSSLLSLADRDERQKDSERGSASRTYECQGHRRRPQPTRNRASEAGGKSVAL